MTDTLPIGTTAGLGRRAQLGGAASAARRLLGDGRRRLRLTEAAGGTPTPRPQEGLRLRLRVALPVLAVHDLAQQIAHAQTRPR